VKDIPVEGCCGRHWLTGLLSTQTKEEGIVLRSARHWGRDRSVVNNPLVALTCTQLYLGLPSAWGSVDDNLMFSQY
jgi:hypothetical protein